MMPETRLQIMQLHHLAKSFPSAFVAANASAPAPAPAPALDPAVAASEGATLDSSNVILDMSMERCPAWGASGEDLSLSNVSESGDTTDYRMDDNILDITG